MGDSQRDGTGPVSPQGSGDSRDWILLLAGQYHPSSPPHRSQETLSSLSVRPAFYLQLIAWLWGEVCDF